MSLTDHLPVPAAIKPNGNRRFGAIAIPRPKRWDRPFGSEMSDEIVLHILSLPPFRGIDPSRFPDTLSLWDIIRNDTRIRRFQRGDIIVRKGDYGNSVFLILIGSARAVMDSGKIRKDPRRRDLAKRALTQAVSRLWRSPNIPERRDLDSVRAEGEVVLRKTRSEETRTRVRNLEALLSNHPTTPLGELDMFGEVAALSRTPHVATVFAESDLVLLELRWQGLRDIRRRDDGFRDEIDALYRASSLQAHLGETWLFRHLDRETRDNIAAKTVFLTHGEFEWARGFKEIAAKEPEEVIEAEPVIAEQGDHLDGLLLVRSGFVRITEQMEQGHRTVGYLTQNEVFGLEEIVDHWRHGGDIRLRYGLRAIGFVDLLLVPTDLVETLVLPTLPASRLPGARSESRWPRRRSRASGLETPLDQPALNFLVNTRTINGTAAMFINTDRCTACDECVRACAATHDNNARFVRHGVEHDNWMVANACMHCVDPVCLIGCPTGAIHRDADDGQVLIDESTCIGCTTCAQSCPYDNIRMVEIRDQYGGFIVDTETQQPIVKATKCDLCQDQLGGPACQRACPHDALVRLDLRDRERLVDWLER